MKEIIIMVKKCKGIYIFNNGNKFNGEWYDNKTNIEGDLELIIYLIKYCEEME